MTSDTAIHSDNAVPTNLDYDLVVIGAGPGGYSAALRAAELGLNVAIVDRNPHPGGTCVHRGCIPTKALIQATHTLSSIREAQRFGIHASIEDIDFGAMHTYIRSMVRETSQGVADLLKYRNVHTLVGTASVECINSHIADAQSQYFEVHITPPAPEQPITVTAQRVILALGSSPTPLSINGNVVPWSASVLNSTGVLALTSFPESVVIIGSGVIATEFASLWAEAGVHVTMIARSRGAMAHTDRHINAIINQSLKRQGVTVYSGYQVTQLHTGDNLGVQVHITDRTDQARDDITLEADCAVVAIGRHPNTGASWIQQLGISAGKYQPIQVSNTYETRVSGMYAIGDCIEGPQLAHAAFSQGIAVAEHIAQACNTQGIEQTTTQSATELLVPIEHIPHVVFSAPEIATIGLQTEQASHDPRYSEVREDVYPMAANARTRMLAQRGSITIVSAVRSQQSTDTENAHPAERIVVGVHMIGPQVSEFIAEAQQIVANEIPLHEAASRIHAHPTLSESLGEALLRADGRPLHVR